MNSAFEKAFAYTLGNEGGYSNDPNDAGGETCWGITIVEARRHGYQGNMKDLPIEFAKQIYLKDYWNANHCDEIASWYYPAAQEVFDTGVNCGIGTEGKFFQQVLNFMNLNQRKWLDIIEDGQIGPITLSTMNKITSDSEKKLFTKILNCLQAERYFQICRNNKTQEIFIRSWMSRVDI
jgi:lysozyme family protein